MTSKRYAAAQAAVMTVMLLWLLAAAARAGLPPMPNVYASVGRQGMNVGFDPYANWPGSAQFSGFGQLSGLVVDSAGRPLPGADIQLECGLSATAGADGTFLLPQVPAGDYRARITMPGYKIGQGQVQIAAGAVRTLKVSLSPLDSAGAKAAPPPKYADFTAIGKALYYGPKDRRVWVYKIEVYEKGNPGNCWQDSWWDDCGDTQYELRCEHAILGHYYNIKITWRNHRNQEKSDNWDVQFTYPDENFSYDHPFDR